MSCMIAPPAQLFDCTSTSGATEFEPRSIFAPMTLFDFCPEMPRRATRQRSPAQELLILIEEDVERWDGLS